jgi:hypothetical protein
MGRIVRKHSATSVRDSDHIRNVARLVSRSAEAGAAEPEPES